MAESALAKKTQTSLRLLLVEDNPSDAFVIEEMLSENVTGRYEMHHARTQSEAVMALDDKAFDACLLDLTLPDATGFSALIDIQEKSPDMPVIILTGVRDAGLAKRAVGRGAQDYLLKDELEPELLTRSIDYAQERKHIEKELFRRANYDALTGLANRSLFETRLKIAIARAGRTDAGMAVLFLDLDRFKGVNDVHGHEAGDMLLKAVATRITGVLRAYDTAARLGGDEFAILLENIASPRDAAAIAHKIIDALAPHIHYRDTELSIGVSIGIAFSEAYEQPESLMRQADAAMYQAKLEGGSAYRFYSPEVHSGAKSRLKKEDDLRLAISQGQLRLYYQPYVMPSSEAILGVEALLRWMHPKHGMLYPEEFLGMAEECRLMPDIGKWMFSRLQSDIHAWNAQTMPPLEIAFNICASQLDVQDFMDWISPLATGEATRPHRLVAEIDSDALNFLSQSRFLTLAKMREMGVALHLDHFGQGPVSLQTLHTYPFSLLKLNLAAIERMNAGGQADGIILTAIELAHQLGMKAGAVGVETAWQMQSLKRQRCDVMQGFLIGHPMMAEQVPIWLSKAHSGINVA